ncbi:hypothetical protein COV15_02205 [Candidatus Woesearchaeota archaeon CG10_big_fil_rev_8_21_14_0_10_34_12]|nr:MAG: hypothetical protein COV15_02205 [Candidatus Woesearchaeota archaeon CG10_big_fil_rev_8_21_14_0_10_34_12]
MAYKDITNYGCLIREETGIPKCLKQNDAGTYKCGLGKICILALPEEIDFIARLKNPRARN